MSNHDKVDALVVGARCAGAAAAMLMARAGLKVRAIDRGTYGSDTLSTHALMRAGVLQLHRWGILPRVQARGTPAIRHTHFHYGQEVIEVPIRAAAGVDALYAPRRTVLDSTLVDAALDAGAEIRHRTTVMGLLRRADGRVRGAVVLDDQGRSREMVADLVVGADGLGSAVARLADAPLQRVARHATAVIYGHWAGIKMAGYHWFYQPGLGAGVIPTNAGRHCVFLAIPPARYKTELRLDPAAGYRRMLAELSPELAAAVAGARQDGPLHVFAGRRGFMRKPWGPGWALVGDAGYFKDPLTAHGMTDALRDVQFLVSATISGEPAAFESYAGIRDSLSLPLFEVTDAIASFEWDLERLKHLHLALNEAMKQETALLAGMAAEPKARGRPLPLQAVAPLPG